MRPIAHRGWHDGATGRVENTAPAFSAAVAKGYGIECDLQAAEDGTPMVFHDSKLDRLVAGAGPIAAHSPRSLARLRYRGQDERILSFAQFLDLVAGRAPALVEVKRNGCLHPRFLENVARLAAAYKGPIALMSFDRATVSALGQLAPAIPRGTGDRQPSDAVGSVGRAEEAAREPGGLASPGFGPRGRGLLCGQYAAGRGGAGLDVAPLAGPAALHLDGADAAPACACRRWADAPIFEGYEA